MALTLDAMTKKQLSDNRALLGQQLTDIRKERGLTQQQVADASGMQRPHIARIEAGKYNVGIDILAKVAAALGCSIEVTPK